MHSSARQLVVRMIRPAYAGSRVATRTSFLRLMLVALVLVTSVSCPALLAQTAEPPPAQIADVQFGLGKVMVAERLMPVTVRIAGGTTPVSGEARISFSQDGTQRTTLVRPFSTTPGKTIDLPFVLALPLHPHRVTVSIRGQGFRESIGFTTGASNDASSLPFALSNDALVIGVVADGQLTTLVPQALTTALQPKTKEQVSIPAERRIGPVQVWAISPTNMPLAPAALDTLNALVIRETSILALEPRQTDALRAWLQRGGTVVVVANQPGSAVARLLGDLPEPFALGDAQAASPLAPKALERLGMSTSTVSLAQAFGFRPIRLTPDGQRDGWTTILPLNAGEAASDPSAGSLGAYGPVGFGRMLVLGFDPTRVSEPLSDEATAQVWKSLLTDSTHLVKYDPRPDEDRYSFVTAGSGGSHASSVAIEEAISNLCTPRVPSYAMIYVIGGGGLLLALLIGPIDLVVLGWLKRRHMAWMTATAWLALASGIAWFLPDILRPIPGSANRMEVVDVLVAAQGVSRPPLAFTAGVSSIFAAAGGSNPRPVGPSTYFRGVSTTSSVSGSESDLSTPELLVTQDSTGATLPLEFDLRRSTLRSFIDDAPTPAPPGFTLSGTPDSPRVTITNLPKGAQVVQSQLLLPRAALTLKSSPDATILEPSGFERSRDGSLANFHQALHQFAPTNSRLGRAATMISDTRPDGSDGPVRASALSIPGAESRAAALSLRDRSQRFAILLLRVTDLPASFTVAGCQEHLRSAVYRVAIPLPDSFRAGTPVAPLLPGPPPETPS